MATLLHKPLRLQRPNADGRIEFVMTEFLIAVLMRLPIVVQKKLSLFILTLGTSF